MNVMTSDRRLFNRKKMTKSLPFWLLTTLFLTIGFTADAQQPVKVPKIGWLGFRPVIEARLGNAAFQRELGELGYVMDKNITIEYRSAEGRPDRFRTLADELVRLKVDVLITPGTPATLAAKNATRTIPIVFTGVADPVPTGLVDSLARPGGNITGFTEISERLAGKRLMLLKETIPKLSRVAVLWNPRNPGNAQQWEQSQLSAAGLGLELQSIKVSSADNYESAFKEAIKMRSGALAIAQDSLAQFNLKLLSDLATKNWLPAIYSRGEFVDGGGLMAYGPDPAETYRRVAVLVEKILKGTKPGDLPVEQPTKFELVINLKTAKQLGLMIPPNVLARADKVIR